MEMENNHISPLEKPKFLYHSSKNSDIAKFEPRLGKRRDLNEGAQIFATPSRAMATIFLVETDDSWTESGVMNGVPYIVISDRERFLKEDKGGTIYRLPSDSFESDHTKGLRELEYTSNESVVPVSKENVVSALDAMLESGVKVFFADEDIFKMIKISDGRGEDIIKNLVPYTDDSSKK